MGPGLQHPDHSTRYPEVADCSTDRGCNRLRKEEEGPLKYFSFLSHWMRPGPLACFRTDDQTQPVPTAQKENLATG